MSLGLGWTPGEGLAAGEMNLRQGEHREQSGGPEEYRQHRMLQGQARIDAAGSRFPNRGWHAAARTLSGFQFATACSHSLPSSPG